jgi:predicted MFS family arabinose efflux permease
LFWVDGLTNIVAAALMWWFVKPINHAPVHKQKTVIKRSESAWRDGAYIWFILFNVMFACCFFQLFTNLSVYYKLKINFTEPFIGFLMATNGVLIVALEMVLIYKLEGKKRSTYFIVIGVMFMGLAYLILSLVSMNHLLALLLVVIITFGEITAMPFMNSFWSSRTKPHNRGQYAALYTRSWSAAQTLGPMAGAQVADRYGFHALWCCICGLSFITAFAFFRLHRRMGSALAITEKTLPASGL